MSKKEYNKNTENLDLLNDVYFYCKNLKEVVLEQKLKINIDFASYNNIFRPKNCVNNELLNINDDYEKKIKNKMLSRYILDLKKGEKYFTGKIKFLNKIFKRKLLKKRKEELRQVNKNLEDFLKNKDGILEDVSSSIDLEQEYLKVKIDIPDIVFEKGDLIYCISIDRNGCALLEKWYIEKLLYCINIDNNLKTIRLEYLIKNKDVCNQETILLKNNKIESKTIFFEKNRFFFYEKEKMFSFFNDLSFNMKASLEKTKEDIEKI